MAGFNSFVDLAAAVRGQFEVDIDGFGNMADGKPPQLRCIALGNLDWVNSELGKFAGIPRLIQKVQDDNDLDDDEVEEFYAFAVKVVERGVRYIREVSDDGEERWVPCRIVTDDSQDAPVLVNGTVMMPLRTIDVAQNIMTLAGAILRDSNVGGRMAALATAEGFSGDRAEEPGQDSSPGEAPEMGAP